MNTKSIGEIAYDGNVEYQKSITPQGFYTTGWANLRTESKGAYESAAAAVLRDYDQHYDTKRAFNAGSKIQCKWSHDSEWVDVTNPMWLEQNEYRVAPEPEPPPPLHQVEIKIPSLKLETGKFSFATN